MGPLTLAILAGQKDSELSQIIRDLKAFKRATGLGPNEEAALQAALGRQAALCEEGGKS